MKTRGFKALAMVLVMGIALLPAVGAKAADGVDVYRLNNPANGEYLYTADKNEVMILSQDGGWVNEGVAWTAPSTGIPIYRLNNPGGFHLYTQDKKEVKELTSKHGFVKDNNGMPMFYSGGSCEIYRAFDPATGRHLLTGNGDELSSLISNSWNNEGVKIKASSLPDFATKMMDSDVAAQYAKILLDNKLKISDYDFQNPRKPISFCDITGDGIPEMFVFKTDGSLYPNFAELSIYTCVGGSVRELNYEWTEEYYNNDLVKFNDTIRGAKYIIYKGKTPNTFGISWSDGDEALFISDVELQASGNTASVTNVLDGSFPFTYLVEQGVYEKEFSNNNVAISEDEYISIRERIWGNIDRIIMVSGFYDDIHETYLDYSGARVYSDFNMGDSMALTFTQAMKFLQPGYSEREVLSNRDVLFLAMKHYESIIETEAMPSASKIMKVEGSLVYAFVSDGWEIHWRDRIYRIDRTTGTGVYIRDKLKPEGGWIEEEVPVDLYEFR